MEQKMEAQANGNFENNPAKSEKKRNQQGLLYECKYCKYFTRRKFNLERHERRIHKELKKKYICCQKEISTKGEYYLHVETYHPQTRPKAEVSRNIYKIVAEEIKVQIIIKTPDSLTEADFLSKLTSDQLAYLEDINFDEFPRL